MKTVGNILWLVFCGLWSALGWLLWAAILAITIVGLPFARQCVKLARFSLWPFGRMIVKDPSATKLGVIGAVLWFIPGIILAIGYVISGAVLCLTIIGIPFGIQSIKMAGLALQPFGKKIIRSKDVGTFYASSAVGE
ncbi:MAG: YccF domain-containing protein [Actinomycetota bacterium]|nr:MAG: YccF domain-containing protein [Actinomycetota bacterium]